MLQHYKLLLLIAVVILSLWFLLGFVVPIYILSDLEVGGVFGDSFSSVNALFSGLGFLALAYTIFLQIENTRDQKREARFVLLIKHLDELKSDLNNVRYQTFTGAAAIDLIKDHIDPKYYQYFKLESSFLTLYSICQQFLVTINLIEKHKKDSLDEYILAKDKAVLIYISYLDKLHEHVKFYKA